MKICSVCRITKDHVLLNCDSISQFSLEVRCIVGHAAVLLHCAEQYKLQSACSIAATAVPSFSSNLKAAEKVSHYLRRQRLLSLMEVYYLVYWNLFFNFPGIFFFSE